MHVKEPSHDVLNLSFSKSFNIESQELDYSCYASQERISLVVFSVIFIVSTIVISTLLGLGVVSTIFGGVLYAALLTFVCLACILFVFIRNVMRYSIPVHNLQESFRLKKSDVNFLQTITQLSFSFLTKHPQEHEQFCVSPQIQQTFSTNKEDTQLRIASTTDVITHLTDSITNLLTSCTSINSALKEEVRSLFMPKWIARQTPALNALRACCQLVQTCPTADLIILMEQNPGIAQSLVDKLLQFLSKWELNYSSNSPYITQALRTINMWHYGWFLQANNIEILKEYNLSTFNKVQHCFEQGNFIELILQHASKEQCERLNLFLNNQALSHFSVKSISGVNSLNYLRNPTFFKEFLEEAKEKMMLVKDLPSASSPWFMVSLGMNYSKINECLSFIFKNFRVFIKNPFLIMEMLHEQVSMQSFLHGVLQKFMPLNLWKALLQPFITGVFASGLLEREEVSVFTQSLCISNEELKKYLEQSVLLERLLPHLFANES